MFNAHEYRNTLARYSAFTAYNTKLYKLARHVVVALHLHIAVFKKIFARNVTQTIAHKTFFIFGG